MGKSNIKFSITIPAFKQRYLYEAIDSVLNQSYNDFELIIVDDCSPEDLKSIVDNYHDSRIKYYRNEKNCGAINVVDNWNICLSYCSGDYVICMGDDDRLLPNCLEELEKLIVKYPSLDVYHAWTQIIDENGVVKRPLAKRKEYENVFSLISHRIKGDYQFIGDFCYKLSSLKECGGYYKLPLAWCSDDITSYRAAEKCGIANTQTICFEYRVSSLTITKQVSKEITDYKVNSLLFEKKWIEGLVSKFQNFCFNSDDKTVYTQIQDDLSKYISSEVSQLACIDIMNCQRGIFYWIRLFCRNRLSIFIMFKILLYKCYCGCRKKRGVR